jgi:CzcA family heavy metal efflux pump
MNFTAWAQQHARSILFLLGALALAGAVTTVWLPVALFPQVSFPRVRISIDAGDRPADQMTIEVTTPVEEAVRAIPGVRNIRSATTRGSAEISINFDWGEDMVAAMLQAESQVNRILPTLPPGTTFEVERMDPTVFPVIAYSVTSASHSLVELHDLALYTLRPGLSTVTGVSHVSVLGGQTEEYRVTIDPDKLQSFNLTLDEVGKALSASNVLTAVGRLEQYDKLYLTISDTRFKKLEEIEQTVLRSTPAGVVFLEDVATVEPSTEPQWTRVTADGRDAVLFQVYQQPGGNTVQIATGIKEKLAAMEKLIPQGVKIANWYDQSDLIVASGRSTRDAVLIGIVLASIVLLVFLRNWKVTLIAALTVPAVLATTILLLFVFKMSFNIMTLGGMAAAVGLIIDDAIVMVEHIIRRVRGQHAADSRGRVLSAAAEFTQPLAGSSAATIVMFAPLAFLSGVTGAFFKALSLTMAAALIISFLIAWLAVPILSARFLTEKDTEAEKQGRWMRSVHQRYRKIMTRLLARPILILLFLVPLVLLGYVAYKNVASGFMPVMDEGGFILDYVAPPGTSLAETDRLLRQLEGILQETPEIETYSRRTGVQLGGGLSEANIGDFFIRLKPLPRRPIEEVMDDVRTQIEAHVPGLEIETTQLMEDLIGDLTSVPQPIEIKLYSDDEAKLTEVANKVAAAIQKVSGIVEVKNGIVPAGDALNIEVDRVKAGLEGMDPDAITKSLSDYLTGSVTTKIQKGPKLIGVRAWIPRAARETIHNVEGLLLRAPDGHLFPLKRVATLTRLTGQPQIMRDDLRRMIAVTARISGRDLGSTAADVKRLVDQPGTLPADVPYTLGGLYEQQQIAFRGLTIILIAAVVLVFLLLLFLYESFRASIAMMLTTLLAVAGVYLGLWVTRTEFNITSRMGMTMIIGIVTEITIFYLSEYRELPPSDNRFIQAGLNRMRPIAMTTFAAILALLPLALGFGQGSAMQQPLAIAIISGLLFGLPLVLIVLPVLLSIFGAASHWRTTSVVTEIRQSPTGIQR